MDLAQLTMLIFTGFSALRVVSYAPQIAKVAADQNGATAISYSTWGLWTAANTATALYAAVNLQDLYLASVSAIYTLCCVIVIVLTAIKRRRVAKRRATPTPPSGLWSATPARRLALLAASLASFAVGFGTLWSASDTYSGLIASNNPARTAWTIPAPSTVEPDECLLAQRPNPRALLPKADPAGPQPAELSEGGVAVPEQSRRRANGTPRQKAKADDMVDEEWRPRTLYRDILEFSIETMIVHRRL